MATLQLTATELALYNALEPLLDSAFASGINNPAGKQLIAALGGYTTAASVPGAVPPDQRPVVRQSFEIALIPLLRAFVAGAPWVEISSFSGGWSNLAGFDTAAYYQDAFGEVHLKGTIHGGSIPSVVFTLPYAPAATRDFIVLSNSTVGQVRVLSSGDVQVVTPSVTTSVSLNGIHFRP